MNDDLSELKLPLTQESPTVHKKQDKSVVRLALCGLVVVSLVAAVFLIVLLFPPNSGSSSHAESTATPDESKDDMTLGAHFRGNDSIGHHNFTLLPTYNPDAFVIRNDSFFFHNDKVQLIAGDVHYQRIHPALWRDRLLRVRAMGINAIQTYVVWNVHEPSPGAFEWEGFADLDSFVSLVHELGMFVLLRVGPYICGEWEFGGLPAWLAAEQPAMKIRTFSPPYIAAVDRWWNVLLPRMSRFLVQNGGPVVMVQIENEYGYWGDVQHNKNDRAYMEYLITEARDHLGPDIILFTTDPPAVIVRGTFANDQVFSTVDFGPGAFSRVTGFAAQHLFNPPGMKVPMCSELYTGWVVNWGETMVQPSSADLAASLTAIITAGGSFSLYMAHGGTNFNWMAGSGLYTVAGFKADITSYDYNAPLSEEGRHNAGREGTDKFLAVRNAIALATGVTPPEEPPQLPVASYGTVTFHSIADVISNLDLLANRTVLNVSYPVPMETLGMWYGCVAYTVPLQVPRVNGGVLIIRGVADRAHVFLDHHLLAKVEGGGDHHVRIAPSLFHLPLRSAQQLTILVENAGRINFRSTRTFDMDGRKGIVYSPQSNAITFNKHPIPGPWRALHLPFSIDDISRAKTNPISIPLHNPISVPSLLFGTFNIPDDVPADTFVLTRGWGRGLVWVNGLNLGRYFEEKKRPQHTLYVPAPVLRKGSNDIVVLELIGVENLSMKLVDAPQFDY